MDTGLPWGGRLTLIRWVAGANGSTASGHLPSGDYTISRPFRIDGEEMGEWRTQEQIDADQEMHKALMRVLAAYSNDPENHAKFMLTEFLVISARVGITDDKAQNTFYDYTLSNGSIPWHSM